MNIFEPAIFYCILSFAVSSVILLLAVLLLGIRVPPNESLTNFNDARKYLALSYFVLSIAGFIRFFSQGEAENQLQLASCTLIIGSLQALLFTYTILTLIQPLYIKTKQIYTQLAIISIVGIVLFLALFFGTDILFTWIFYLIIVAYILQMAYYTYIYQLSYNACLHTLETYYEDDERARLRWVNFFFYCALAVGIVAIISLFLNLYFYMLFCIVYTFYYAYVVWRFYNYQIDFKFAMPIIYNKGVIIEEVVNKNTTLSNPPYQEKKCEEFTDVLNKWVREKKFIQKDISVDDIAESLGVTHSFLQYYFRKCVMIDFRTWRSKLRIQEAQRLIENDPDISLEELREMVGFNHRANFYQQFQKITEMSPTEYKKHYSRSF